MATTTETLLLQVDIQANNARLAELSGELRKAKEEYAQLQAMQKAGTITTEQLDAASVKYKATLAANAQEVRVLTAANAAQQKITEAAAGSIDELRARLALNTRAYNALSAAERDNSEAGQRLQAETKAISDELKRLEKSVGDTRRNVGNYKDSVKEAIQESGLFGGITERVTGVQEQFNGAQKIAKAVMGESAVASRVLGAALIAIPIFVVVAALGALYKFLTSTQQGMDFVTQKTAGLSAAFRVVSNVVIDVGAKIFEAIQSPRQALSDFVDFLQQNVANRLNSVAVLVDAIRSRDFKKLADGTIQLATGITNATERASSFAKQIDAAATSAEKLALRERQLQRAEDDNINTNKLLLNQVERLKNVRDNEALAIQKRISANEQAYTLELTRESTLVRIAQQRVELLRDQIAQEGGRDRVSRERYQELKNAENELSDIQEDAAGKQNEFITNRFALNKEKLEQEAALRENAIKSDIAAIQTRLLSVKAGSDEELALRQRLIRRQADLEKAGADKTAADRKLILAKALADELKLDEDFDKARQERAAKFLSDQDKANATAASYQKQRLADAAKDQEDAYTRNEQLLQRNLDRRAATLEQDYAEGKVSKENYEKGLEILEENGLAARIVLQRQFNKDSAQLEAQLAKRQGALRAATLEKEEQMNLDRLRSAQEFGGAVGQLFANTLNDTGQSLQEFAGKVLILILDTLEKSVLAATAEAAAKSIALNPTPAGFIQAALTTAAITVAFEAAKAAIGATTAEPFNTGGIVGGDTSVNRDSVLTYLTPGEVVLSQGVTQKYPELLPVLSQLNTMGGGASFAPGGRAATIDGGLAGRNAVAGFDYNRFAEASAKHPIDVNYVAVVDKAAARQAKINKTTLGAKK